LNLKALAAAGVAALALAAAGCGSSQDYTSTYPASFTEAFVSSCVTSPTGALFPNQANIGDECACALTKIEQSYPYAQMVTEASDLPPEVVDTAESCRS
jgi:hypothetical protein